MAQNKVIVRFPPSPTGLLHVGSVRTALYNFLFARKNSGKFILRIEDTDKERGKKEYEDDIIKNLEWLGIDYDNKNDVWRQSERTLIYKKYLDLLIKSGAAYVSQENEGENKEVIRFRNPGGKIKFHDLIRGDVEMDVSDLNDFIIAKNINEPLYHLVVVVDDMETGVTHIIRGEDGISNTPRQILIWRALAEATKSEFELPEYAHLPLVLDENRAKLSKRKLGEVVSLNYYRNKGYEPEAILNFLALIGWNPGTEQEIFTIDGLIQAFDLSKVQKKGGIFNIEKLDWVNREHILRQSPEIQISKLKFQIENSKWKDSDKFRNSEFLEKFMEIMINRIHRWGEVCEILNSGELDYLFSSPEIIVEKIPWKGETVSEAKEHLNKVAMMIENNNTEKDILQYAEEMGKGNVLWPLRYALSGKDKSPDPMSLLSILGSEECIKRVKRVIDML